MRGSLATRLMPPFGVLMVLTGIAWLVLSPAMPALPAIQGAWLMPAQTLPEFRLEQHNGTAVTQNTLPGSWHLVTYGFTHCPDVCPTTLLELARFKRALNAQHVFNDLQVHFYTVDPQRDSLTRLANYAPWFHDQFTGWRAVSAADARSFESALGIHAKLTRDARGSVEVTHGLRLFLMNSEGRLQAVLEPTRSPGGQLYFEPDQLLNDYQTIRRWVDRGS